MLTTQSVCILDYIMIGIVSINPIKPKALTLPSKVLEVGLIYYLSFLYAA